MAGDSLANDVIELPFEVPADWVTPRLSIYCDFIRDGDWIETKDQGGADFRLLQISNIGIGRFVETGNYRWITQETFHRLNCTEIIPGRRISRAHAGSHWAGVVRGSTAVARGDSGGRCDHPYECRTSSLIPASWRTSSTRQLTWAPFRA